MTNNSPTPLLGTEDDFSSKGLHPLPAEGTEVDNTNLTSCSSTHAKISSISTSTSSTARKISTSSNMSTTLSTTSFQGFDLTSIRADLTLRHDCIAALEKWGFVLMELDHDDDHDSGGPLEKMGTNSGSRLAIELNALADFFEDSGSHRLFPERNYKWSRLLKCGFCVRHGGSFLDVKNTPLGIRPKISKVVEEEEIKENDKDTSRGDRKQLPEEHSSLGSDSYPLLRDLSLEFLEYIREYCEIQPVSAFSHVLTDETSAAEKENYAASASVLRCSMYNALENAKRDPGRGLSAASSDSFPEHTDATFLTCSLATSGLEFQLVAEPVSEGEEHKKCAGSCWKRIEDIIVPCQSKASGESVAEPRKRKLFLTLWVGDFLEVLTGGRFKALPHRIRFHEQRDRPASPGGRQRRSGCPFTSGSASRRHNITFLLRPDDEKILDTTGNHLVKDEAIKMPVKCLRKFLDRRGRNRVFGNGTSGRDEVLG
ncbi:unnamed protein product [Amoebophrya sp. A25]|nr:unnamed protein product [Amoebophrya sp. A25]|eukprot:GSA25T00017070001.1